MSNRQLVILGSFALACCVIIAVAFRGAGSNPPPPPTLDDKSSPGRYQVVGVQQGDQTYLVILDTNTGVTWQRRLHGDLAYPDGWNPITSPAQPSRVWTQASISNM